ncbi:MAG: hypothetical protein Q9168_007278 [Polycauliona sp. 1 TL-2023]
MAAMEPNGRTRHEYTQFLLSAPISSQATPDWKDLLSKLRVLLEKLAAHEVMADSIDQTYGTPLASQNRIAFMWDSIGQIIVMLFTQTDPSIITPTTTKEQKLAWLDAFRRAKALASLIMDRQKGQLNQMIEQAFPNQKGEHPDFGPEIRDLAKDLYDWCEIQLPGA